MECEGYNDYEFDTTFLPVRGFDLDNLKIMICGLRFKFYFIIFLYHDHDSVP